MRTILLIIEFDGTCYAGWQVQPNGLAVQEVIEKALAKILKQEVRIHSSGRTDAGVHAHGMAAHFQAETKLPLTAFREGVNCLLPQDIVIREAREMPNSFHARFSAKGKWYRYCIYQNEVRSPISARTSWHISQPLDLGVMQSAAELLVGEHDFKAFRTASCAAKTTTRKIFRIDVRHEGNLIFIDVVGSGFLKNMVRMIVGTLVEIGLGRRPIEDTKKLVSGKDHIAPGPTAPAHGLCLQEVWY